jgi:hypothetical protein
MSTSISRDLWDTWYPTLPDGPTGWKLQGDYFQIPPTIGGQGIFSPEAANQFNGWNKVYAYYCSSDEWSGRNTDKVFADPNFPSPPNPAYSVTFRGATIFDAIISTLRSGTLTYCIDYIENECHTMPDLDNASMVLLAGSSAGANGVKHNLDRFREKLTGPGNPAANPDMQVRGVFDAGGFSFASNLPWPTEGPFTSYEQYVIDQWENVYQYAWNARLDASCLSQNPLELQYRCADTTHVLRHHITTPFFNRVDLQDPHGTGTYKEMFYATPPYEEDVPYERVAKDVADLLADIGNVFGPRCEQHIALVYNNPFFVQQAPDASSVLHTYHDTLWQWVNQVPGGILGPLGPVYIETPARGSSSSC